MRCISKAAIRTLCALFFLSHCVFLHSAETNFWDERQKIIEGIKTSDEGPAQLARLPIQNFLNSGLPNAIAQNPAEVLRQIPLEANFKMSPSLSKKIRNSIPHNQQAQLLPIVESLSSAVGTIRKISHPANLKAAEANRSKVVVHIQDVHLNAEAQKNIAQAVQNLFHTNKVGVMALEGAFDEINLAPITSFPNKKATLMAADYLLKQNRISGPVYASLTSSVNLPDLIGVDDAAAYNANVAAYVGSLESKKEIQSALLSRQNDIKKSEFDLNPDLAKFHADVERYRSGQLSIGGYVQVLSKWAHNPSYNVNIFQEAYAMETSLNFAIVETERTALLGELLPKLTQAETTALLNASIAYRLGNSNHTDFYSNLKTLLASKQISLNRYKAMDDYIRYVLLSDLIDPEQLLSDVATMEHQALQALVRTPDERNFINESRRLYLVGKLVDFSLIPAEWAELQSLSEKTAVPSLKGSRMLLAGHDLTSFRQFYAFAQKRDRAMTKNLLRAMDKQKTDVAVLVTGGFHAPGIDALLRQAGVTTITFVPKISSVEDDNGSTYLSVFSQEKTPLDQLFKGEKLFMAPSPNQTALAPALQQAADDHLETKKPTVEVKGKTGALSVMFAGGAIESVFWNPIHPSLLAESLMDSSIVMMVGLTVGLLGVVVDRVIRKEIMVKRVRSIMSSPATDLVTVVINAPLSQAQGPLASVLATRRTGVRVLLGLPAAINEFGTPNHESVKSWMKANFGVDEIFSVQDLLVQNREINSLRSMPFNDNSHEFGENVHILSEGPKTKEAWDPIIKESKHIIVLGKIPSINVDANNILWVRTFQEMAWVSEAFQHGSAKLLTKSSSLTRSSGLSGRHLMHFIVFFLLLGTMGEMGLLAAEGNQLGHQDKLLWWAQGFFYGSLGLMAVVFIWKKLFSAFLDSLTPESDESKELNRKLAIINKNRSLIEGLFPPESHHEQLAKALKAELLLLPQTSSEFGQAIQLLIRSLEELVGGNQNLIQYYNGEFNRKNIQRGNQLLPPAQLFQDFQYYFRGVASYRTPHLNQLLLRLARLETVPHAIAQSIIHHQNGQLLPIDLAMLIEVGRVGVEGQQGMRGLTLENKNQVLNEVDQILDRHVRQNSKLNINPSQQLDMAYGLSRAVNVDPHFQVGEQNIVLSVPDSLNDKSGFERSVGYITTLLLGAKLKNRQIILDINDADVENLLPQHLKINRQVVIRKRINPLSPTQFNDMSLLVERFRKNGHLEDLKGSILALPEGAFGFENISSDLRQSIYVLRLADLMSTAAPIQSANLSVMMAIYQVIQKHA